MITVPHTLLAEQIRAVFLSWGMRPEPVETAVELVVEADLRGIDSHGIGMLPTYDQRRRDGKIDPLAEVCTLREGPVLTLVDAGHGLGHPAARFAMERACDKAALAGLGVSVVVHSNHFGAAGVYSTIAAERGLIGFACTGTTQRSVVPTGAREPRFSTNPIAFAASPAEGDPFSLDMATSTVAVGKVNIARRAGKPLPEGWALRPDGRPETDAAAAFDAKPKRLTPLGGNRTLGSHKGYGLAVMVDILASVLGGANVGGIDLGTGEPGRFIEVGHFFLALDPAFFNADFAADLGGLMAELRASPPADPAQPVLVPGDPEHEARRERLRTGLPMTETLFEEIRAVAAGSGAPFLLERACPAVAC